LNKELYYIARILIVNCNNIIHILSVREKSHDIIHIPSVREKSLDIIHILSAREKDHDIVEDVIREQRGQKSTT
jgi:hypothetical protein